MLAWTIYCAIVPLKTDYKLLYTFGNNCSSDKIQCPSLEQWHMNTLLVNVWFQKLKYLYPLHGRLFDLHRPPPGFSVPGGFWWPPSPQEFREVFLACGRNFQWRPKADTCSTRVSLTILWKFKVVLVLKNKESEY